MENDANFKLAWDRYVKLSEKVFRRDACMMDLLGRGCCVLLFLLAASLLLSQAHHVLLFVLLSPWSPNSLLFQFYLSTLASFIATYRIKFLFSLHKSIKL